MINTTSIAVNFNLDIFKYNDMVDMLVRLTLPHIMQQLKFKMLIVPFLTTLKRLRAYYSAHIGTVLTEVGEQLILKFDMRIILELNDPFKHLELNKISILHDYTNVEPLFLLKLLNKDQLLVI